MPVGRPGDYPPEYDDPEPPCADGLECECESCICDTCGARTVYNVTTDESLCPICEGDVLIDAVVDGDMIERPEHKPQTYFSAGGRIIPAVKSTPQKQGRRFNGVWWVEGLGIAGLG